MAPLPPSSFQVVVVVVVVVVVIIIIQYKCEVIPVHAMKATSSRGIPQPSY
jgi:hypothetical protein